MELPKHIQIIYSLDGMRAQINSTDNRDEMFKIASQAIEIAEPVQTKKDGKEKILNMLQNEIRSYSKSLTTETEVIQFQLSSSILMLCLQFLEGSLADMQAMIIEYRRRAA